MNLRQFRSLLAFSSGLNFDQTGSMIAASFSTASSMVEVFSLRFIYLILR
jgi:hypothetical protein